MLRVSEKERAYVNEVLDGQFKNSSSGQMVRRLEETFAKTFGVQFAISHVNGTATLHSALVAAGIGPGDEVIVPSLTMASTSFAVVHAGARPVFADVDPDTMNLDPQKLVAHLNPRTKAIIPVALFGLSPDFDPIMEIAKEKKLFVLEDDAQCLLGKYKGKLVGNIGHAASFSFQLSKHITSGEGGMITTNDEALADRVRRFSALGYASVRANPAKAKVTRETIQDPNYERHAEVGWNYRIADLCAAAALAQVERLEELVQVRIQAAKMYEEVLEGCNWLVPQKVPAGYLHSYWTYVVRLEKNKRLSWYDLRRKVIELGGDDFYAAWQLNYLEPAFRGKDLGTGQTLSKGLCPVAEILQPKLVLLKTNYFDPREAEEKISAFGKAIRTLS